MATIRLNINEKVLNKVLWMLGHFSKDEVEIVLEDPELIRIKKEVQNELDLMDQGQAKFVSMQDFDRQVREALAKYGTED